MPDLTQAGTISKSAAKLARRAFEALLPPLCLLCDAPVSQAGTLCAGCFKQIRFLGSPYCARCGEPFTLAFDEEAQCGECLAHPPAYARARAVCRYDDASRRLITALKYNEQTWLAPHLGKWLARACGPAVSEADIILPVPLHRRRLWQRGYNQSLLLARSVSRETGIPLRYDLLERIKPTPPQTGLNQRQRKANVRGAFRLREGGKEEVRGKRLLLVDDVLTTGATANACAKVLLKAGAAEVNVVTFARRCLD